MQEKIDNCTLSLSNNKCTQTEKVFGFKVFSIAKRNNDLTKKELKTVKIMHFLVNYKHFMNLSTEQLRGLS